METLNPMNENSTLQEKMSLYEETKNWLEEYRKAHFPYRSIVKVTNARFHGHGIVMGPSDNAHQVAVKLQNENTWWYEMDTCEVVTDLKQVPQQIRRLKMRCHGRQVMAFYGPQKRLP